MKKKIFIAAAIGFIFLLATVVRVRQKPCRRIQIVSSIVSMDTAYLTVLAEGWERSETEFLRTETVRICRKAAGRVKNLRIAVYLTKKDMENGNAAFRIKL